MLLQHYSREGIKRKIEVCLFGVAKNVYLGVTGYVS